MEESLGMTKTQVKSLMKYISDNMKIPVLGAGGGFAPIGTINPYMGTVAPIGWLACDGTVYNISDYPDLATHIASQFGSTNFFGGDGVTTFAVPDTTDITSTTLENGVYIIKATVAGDPNGEVYSTDETICGTWIDGKDLYQRVLTGTFGTITSGTVSYASITNAIQSDVDTLIDNRVIGSNQGYAWVADSSLRSVDGTNVLLQAGFSKSNHSFYVGSSNTALSNTTIYMIVRYTKS
jgi:hypothetical protein